MIIKPRGTVVLPRRSRPGLDLLPWCREVDAALQQLRDRGINIDPRRGGRGGAVDSTCYFGEVITYLVGETTKTGIRGGTIACGNKNFNVPNKELNLASTGVTLIYLEISVTANNDDDGEILLPGIETSTETTPSGFWKSDPWTAEPVTQYPNNNRPLVTTGVGKIIVPIGKLTIADGAATLEAVGCGNITINHCGGTLTAARG
jgi:hypothetical protein